MRFNRSVAIHNLTVLGEKVRIHFAITPALLCLAAPSLSMAESLGRCEANFQEKGNFFTGQTFSTSEDFTATPDDLFRSTLFAIANEGFQITSQDRDLRMISASQAVTGGEGSTAPLNVMIEDNPAGSRARLTFTIAGGQMMMDARSSICELVQRFDQ